MAQWTQAVSRGTITKESLQVLATCTFPGPTLEAQLGVHHRSPDEIPRISLKSCITEHLWHNLPANANLPRSFPPCYETVAVILSSNTLAYQQHNFKNSLQQTLISKIKIAQTRALSSFQSAHTELPVLGKNRNRPGLVRCAVE